MTAETNAEAKAESGWDRRRSRISAHIEQVALRAFAERGYANVTVADVAEASGMSPRTVARYFPNKEDMLLAFPRRMAEDAKQGLQLLVGSDDPVSGVWELWKTQAQTNARELQNALTWVQAVQSAPEVGRRVPGEQRSEIQGVILGLCADALGVDPADDLRPALLASTLMAANEAICMFWMTTGATGDLPTLFDEGRRALSSDLAALTGSGKLVSLPAKGRKPRAAGKVASMKRPQTLEKRRIT
jgi:AcrR family transcriptional regulator